ncbi:hypothetical protein C4577_05185 [Candidatus Parcubacteria bacterium]|nr:MAG: hypothetical protein C4577_05185 [Candidatus Parcubacteria bacterium]
MKIEKQNVDPQKVDVMRDECGVSYVLPKTISKMEKEISFGNGLITQAEIGFLYKLVGECLDILFGLQNSDGNVRDVKEWRGWCNASAFTLKENASQIYMMLTNEKVIKTEPILNHFEQNTKKKKKK